MLFNINLFITLILNIPNEFIMNLKNCYQHTFL